MPHASAAVALLAPCHRQLQETPVRLPRSVQVNRRSRSQKLGLKQNTPHTGTTLAQGTAKGDSPAQVLGLKSRDTSQPPTVSEKTRLVQPPTHSLALQRRGQNEHQVLCLRNLEDPHLERIFPNPAGYFPSRTALCPLPTTIYEITQIHPIFQS